MKRITLLLVLLLFVSLQVLLAQRKITGTVTSEDDGEPLPGVTIVVKDNPSTGAITDFDGKYAIEVPDGEVTLVFSFVGMRTKEVITAKSTVIDVALSSEDIALDDVVVTAVGIKRETKALGYSVQEVGSDDIEKSNTTDVVNSISGKVAGVRINNSSGAAGGSTFIEIRGSASITGNNQPLFVVDGVPIRSDMDGNANVVDGVARSSRTVDINPDDIASISVLKGGAATALYGLRAANGAVVITTKKGKENTKLQINLNSSVTLDNISMVPELQSKYGQGSKEYAKYYADYYEEDFSWVAYPDGAPWKQVSWGPSIDQLSYTTDPNFYPVDDWAWGHESMESYMKRWDENGRIVLKDDPAANGQPVKTYDQYDYFQQGVTFNNSLSLSGGSATSTYYFSVANQQSEGVVPNNTFDRTTFKLSATNKFTDKFSAGADITYANSKGDRIQQGSNTSGVMLGLLRTPPTFDNSAGYEFPDGTQRSYRGGSGYDNPYWVSNNILFTDDVHRMIGNINFNYKVTDWLSFTYRAGTDWYSRYYRDYFAINSNAASPGAVSTSRYLSRDFNGDFLANINKSFSEDLDFTLTLGHNMYERETNEVMGTANGIDIPEYYHISNSSDVNGQEATYNKRTMAFFGDIGISYKDMLYFNATGRSEQSTTLPEDDNTFFYPSVNTGFVFTELPMLKNNAILSFGKLRASYAITANDAAAYSTETYYNAIIGNTNIGDGWTQNFGLDFPFREKSGFSLSNSMGSKDLKPEKQKTMEIGADLRFLNNRIRLDFTYFKNENEDQLLFVPVAASSGYTSRFMNAGTMETTGIELLVNATVLKMAGFNWDLTLNFSNPKTEVKKLAEGVESIFLGGFVDPQIRAVAGDPYRSIYGTKWLRDPSSGQMIIEDDASLDESYGAGLYGYPIMEDNVGTYGSVQPDWTMGITNSFSYKGLSLSFLIDIKSGGLMWNGTKGALYYFGTHKHTEDREKAYVHEGLLGHLAGYDDNGDPVIKHWENGVEVDGPGAANSVEKPDDENYRFWNGFGSGFTGPSEPYVEKTDWVRLREISVSYSIPRTLLKKTGFIRNLELYFTGRNLWIDTDYTGIDPETSLTGAGNGQGMDYFNMPGTKAVTFGVKLGF